MEQHPTRSSCSCSFSSTSLSGGSYKFETTSPIQWGRGTSISGSSTAWCRTWTKQCTERGWHTCTSRACQGDSIYLLQVTLLIIDVNARVFTLIRRAIMPSPHRSKTLNCKTLPTSSAVLGPASGHEPSQARPWRRWLHSGFGPACMFEKPKPGCQATAFQWVIFSSILHVIISTIEFWYTSTHENVIIEP